MIRTQNLEVVKMKLQEISRKARKDPELQFVSLAHLLTIELLHDSFRNLRKDAAAGIDGVTKDEYEANLEQNLESLVERLKTKSYKAQPARRVYIEKDGGKLRPLGILCLEDKIVQRGVVTILEAIYEVDFLPCSLGFRRGRGQHDALDAVYQMLVHRKVNEVVDVDIESYFDTVVKSELMEFLKLRIKDRTILWLINKWLRAGVLEDGALLQSDLGTPQGAVISPLLANIYLHYVMDKWFANEVLPRLKGEAHEVRYADDIILGFQNRDDAQRVWRVLPKRLQRFGLVLSSKKSRMLPFGRYAAEREAERGRTPQTFNFLGFTHICGQNHQGKFALHLRTMATRLRRSLDDIWEWCKHNRHESLEFQQATLNLKLAGHYQYYGRRTNMPQLRAFYRKVMWSWGHWLRHRGQRRPLTWDTFYNSVVSQYPLLTPRIRNLGVQE